MNIDEIKKISLVEFYQPTGRDSKGQWFYSPCRSEHKPSFHVNPRKGGCSILEVAQEATSSRPTPPIAATKGRNIKAYTPAV